ncbi:uncharacterized protein LOC110260611 isoform X3 [Sus scrofa]|uniref:uncharacterized protein LOC110260611 isoform X3 n=1 Tax=Sus scrofa TaxID=9823 RepID=UPI000A2B6EFB|nr:uncharacterized protein LOC110260611 isoform X3 [Sus scrofa]
MHVCRNYRVLRRRLVPEHLGESGRLSWPLEDAQGPRGRVHGLCPAPRGRGSPGLALLAVHFAPSRRLELEVTERSQASSALDLLGSGPAHLRQRTRPPCPRSRSGAKGGASVRGQPSFRLDLACTSHGLCRRVSGWKSSTGPRLPLRREDPPFLAPRQVRLPPPTPGSPCPLLSTRPGASPRPAASCQHATHTGSSRGRVCQDRTPELPLQSWVKPSPGEPLAPALTGPPPSLGFLV